MSVLRKGMSGVAVQAVQERLKAQGLYKGAMTGTFDDATEAAVTAFQTSRNLNADGKVGSKTMLALHDDMPVPEGMPKVTPSVVGAMCEGAPAENILEYLPTVMAELAKADVKDRRAVLAALATIRAEAAPFAPLNEGRSQFNTTPGGRPFDRYDHMTKLGNQGAGDGERFKGRGFVQLTGRANYAKYGAKIGIDLIANPDAANEPAIAARLLALFIKDCQGRMIAAIDQNRFDEARKLVNGGSHGLTEFTAAYKIGDQRLT
jgi:peptidoglycan hydrolase-like protein with peptidoglycan-binding domain